MTYAQAEAFLLSLSNFPREEYMSGPTHTKAYLERVRVMLDILGNPENKIPHYIHITGTSGKGSTAEMISSIIGATGLTVGTYTSPHISELTERWQVNGKPMSKKQFVTIIEELKPAIDEYLRTSPYGMLSFFDLTVVIALLHFAKTNVHYAVMEVGCGGRYDATNVIPHKDIAIITNIGLDHEEIIGPTKADIAKEKAGIITKATECVFTTETNAKLRSILKHEADIHQVPFTFVAKKHIAKQANTFTSPGNGVHQSKNMALAIEAAKYLGFSDSAIKQGLVATRLPLRMELLQDKPTIFVDGAHNEDKMASTIASLTQLRKKGDLHLILGFSDGKHIEAMIRQLAKLKPKSIACTRNTANSFRKVASPANIAKRCQKHMKQAEIELFADPTQALDWGLTKAKKSDIVLITGSIFLSGELRAKLTK